MYVLTSVNRKVLDFLISQSHRKSRRYDSLIRFSCIDIRIHLNILMSIVIVARPIGISFIYDNGQNYLRIQNNFRALCLLFAPYVSARMSG